MSLSEMEQRRFLETIWGTETSVVRLATRNKDLRFRTTLFQWPLQEELVLNFIESNEATNNEVYFSPDLFKMEALESRHATKDLVLGSRVICLDFDGNAPDSSVWDESGEYEGMPEPTFIVQSSKVDNQHIYWVLDEFITDINLLENMRRAITYRLKSDGSGWDAGQLLRPPGTTNYGYVKGREETYDVFIERSADRAYPASQFAPPKDFRPLISASIDTSTLPSVTSVLANNDFVHGFTELFEKSLEDLGGRERSGAICNVAYFAAESGLSDSEIYVLVQDVDSRWGKYVGRTDRHIQLSRIVDRARTKHPSGLSEIAFGDGWDADGGESEVSPQEVFTWGELCDYSQSIEWFFTGLLSTIGYGIFAGPPGVGKTQIAMRLGKAVALGEKFLEWSPPELGKPGNVLMLALEMNTVSIKEFALGMTDLLEEPFKSKLTEHFRIYPMMKEILLDSPKGRQKFENLLREHKPQLVIIDSLSKAVGKDLSNEEIVRTLNSYLADLRRIYGCAIIVIHHSRKRQAQDKGPADVDSLMGSRYITSEADFVLLFERDKERGMIKLTPAKMRFAETPDPSILQRTSNLDFTVIGPADDIYEGVESLRSLYDAIGGGTPPGGSNPPPATNPKF